MPDDTQHKRWCDVEGGFEAPEPNPVSTAGIVAETKAVRSEAAGSRMRLLRRAECVVADCAPIHEVGADIGFHWADSPLRRPISELAGDLQRIAEAGFVVEVSDESGNLLWTYGGSAMWRGMDQMHHACGGCRNHSPIGTNVLAKGVHGRRASPHSSAEHLVESFHDLVRYSAPIRDGYGRTLGMLDLSTTRNRANPLAMSTVRAMTLVIETRLREGHANGFLAKKGPDVSFYCLGRNDLSIDNVHVHVSPRQAEILALLTLRPDGYTPAELSFELYGDRQVSMSTLKAEVSRLRRMIGGGIAAHRYMLTTEVGCDAVEVLRLLKSGDTTAAVECYRGPLLPRSEAPGVVDWRDRLEVAIREAVLQANDPGPAISLGERIENDPELYEHALKLLGPSDSRTPLVSGRLHVSRRD